MSGDERMEPQRRRGTVHLELASSAGPQQQGGGVQVPRRLRLRRQRSMHDRQLLLFRLLRVRLSGRLPDRGGGAENRCAVAGLCSACEQGIAGAQAFGHARCWCALPICNSLAIRTRIHCTWALRARSIIWNFVHGMLISLRRLCDDVHSGWDQQARQPQRPREAALLPPVLRPADRRADALSRYAIPPCS